MRPDYPKSFLNALLLASILLTACGGGSTGSTTSGTVSVSSTGTDFYLAIPDNLCVSSPALCENVPVTNKLVVASASGTTGEVTFNGVTTPFSVAAGSQTLVALDSQAVLTSNEKIESKAIHVTSQAPVSVHVMSESATSAEGYLALPTTALGTNYYIMSYGSAKYDGSEFVVVATQDNTTVSITPAAPGATRPAGVAFTVTLNSGETYQLANPGIADMTGTFVAADKPVAVFSGHRCTEVPLNVGYCDYIVEQMPDVSIWGKAYHTVPFSGRARYTVRVMASQDGTTVATAPEGMIGTLNAGQFADVTLSGAGEFISDKPVLVTQFVRSYADDATGKGDPSMVVVTPSAVSENEMGATESTFGVYGLAGTGGAYMNVVTRTTALADLKLDNAPLNPALFTPVGPASNYSMATIPVAPGAHTLAGAAPYSALVYDFGIASNSVSHAYPVGGTLTLPVLTEPAPTEPVPTEPVPTEPVPTEPVPTEPAPTEPAPTEPAPTEPAPTEPAPTEPAPTEPAPTEAAPSACAGDQQPNPGYYNRTIHARQAYQSAYSNCGCNGNAYGIGNGSINGNGNAYAYAYGLCNGNGNNGNNN